MRAETLRDPPLIESFLRRNEAAHVYAIADLDEPFWDDTRWFGALEGDALRALCLLLDGLHIPILYAVCPAGDTATRWLLEQIRDALPPMFFYNLGPGLTSVFDGDWRIAAEGTYWKMHLEDPSTCAAVEGADVEPLGPGDFDEVRAFFDDEAYREDELGGLFFERTMLETGCYRAVREAGGLVAVGGVHVHSRRFGVAGIGNVVTRPSHRGRGLARKLSAAVVRALAGDVATIGLNVREDNEPALRCYRRLGFQPVLPYEEGVASSATTR